MRSLLTALRGGIPARRLLTSDASFWFIVFGLIAFVAAHAGTLRLRVCEPREGGRGGILLVDGLVDAASAVESEQSKRSIIQESAEVDREKARLLIELEGFRVVA